MGIEVFLIVAIMVTAICAVIWRFAPAPFRAFKLFKELASFFPILVLAFVIRSFAYEPFRIPSGSMKPVFLEGDFVVIDKYSHGLRWPVTSKRISSAAPKRGDIVVFRGEVKNEEAYVIKRIVGLPGDKVTYKNKQLIINEQALPKTYVGSEYDFDLATGNEYRAHRYHEQLDDIEYDIYNYPFISKQSYPFDDVVVPDGHYFVMGNNRDNSNDARYWGFLSDDKVVGKARMIWFSLDPTSYKPRFSRIGRVS